MPAHLNRVTGLTVVSSFVTAKEENVLLAQIDAQLWLTDLSRRVQHYGYRYDYRRHQVDLGDFIGGLPTWTHFLIDRLCTTGLASDAFDQLIINEYLPGQGISPHVDCMPCFGPTILSLSLGSACVMTFDPVSGGETIAVPLYPRDLLVMTGPARTAWRHGIPARKSDVIDGVRHERSRRVSLTLRTVIVTTDVPAN
jgi:alkylated DNA repair dioxygenase AlkB